MNIVHLTASSFFGGTERQMLELARALPGAYSTRFISFPEGCGCESFLNEVRRDGFEAIRLQHDRPRLFAVLRELTELLRDADILCCHGYKANLLGRWAAWQLGLPTLAVWTRLSRWPLLRRGH